jgi:hypothetical protein
VPELRVKNSGDLPVLILDGEELVGAKQNRIVNVTILVPPHSETVIPVSCIEAGLGAGPQAFRSFSMHALPGSQSAAELWSRHITAADENFEDKPAYQALRQEGMDDCGLAQLASRTVGVPFVGLITAAVALSELLRRLHGGTALELASGSVAALEDVEGVRVETRPYPGAYEEVAAA